MGKSGTIANSPALCASKFQLRNRGALVVGAAHTAEGLRLAAKLRAGDVDLVEIRVDAFAADLRLVRKSLPRITLPMLLTIRHPAEGGQNSLSVRQRRALFAEFLPAAALIDLELRSLPALGEVVANAKAAGVTVVVSDHHFRRTPALTELVARQRRAFAAGADVFKVASLTNSARALACLLELCARPAAGPHAVMGMGRFGPSSRLALAQAGSVLNYGYLHEPNAPGQWEARELRKLLDRLALTTPG